MKGVTLMDFNEVRYEVENGIATVTMNRPEHMNAVNTPLREELILVFGEADRDDNVRAVVVTGAGKAFCAGADLSQGGSRFDYSSEKGNDIPMSKHRDGGGQIALAIFRCRKPVIAAINGHAVGVGITMTLPMDIRIVAEDAKIGFVFTRRGLVPEACSSWFLPRIVGISKAAELIYTGRVFRAAEEANSGLFSYVVPRDDVLTRAMGVAREIAENTSAVSVALSKAMLWHGLGEADPQSAHLVESRCFYWAGHQKDAYEGVESFLEKRSPKFMLRVSSDMPDFYPWWKEPKV
jgi:enoyl-CoA hydratase/carnithine racemase